MRKWEHTAAVAGICLAILAAPALTRATVDNNWSQFHQGNSFAGRASTGPDLRTYATPRFQVGSGLGAAFGGSNASSPVVMNNKIYCYSAGGAVTAFSELTGSQVWSSPIAPSGFGSWSSPSADVASNSVYMGSDEYVYRLDADTGQEQWRYRMTTMSDQGETYATVVNASPTIVPGLGLHGEGLVYQHTFGSFGGGTRLHAINVADGSAAWTLDLTGQGQGPVAYNPTDGLIYTTVGTEGGWAAGRGGIVAIDAATGLIDTSWGNNGYSAGSFEPLSFGGISYDAANNVVAAGGYDFYGDAGLLVADASDGSTAFYSGDDTARSGDYTPCFGDDGMLYVTGGFGNPMLTAWDFLAGELSWRTPSGWGGWNQSVVYAGDVGDGTDVVYLTGDTSTNAGYGMFDADTGELLAMVGAAGSPGALANGNLYYITGDGELVAFGPPVPEPASMALLGLGVLALIRRPRRRVGR